MKIIFSLMMITFCAKGIAQSSKQVSIAFMNATTATPFSHFGNFFSVLHPGLELGYERDISSGKKHDWFQVYDIGYFYHRYVQHAIMLSTGLGYRYRFLKNWSGQVSAGGGYLHSIPATAQLSIDNNGEYKNEKSKFRMQAMAIVNIGAARVINPGSTRPKKIFVTYQAMLQFPFIKAYVPLLPYNNLLAGISMPILKKSK